jgi:hypothetical protein
MMSPTEVERSQPITIIGWTSPTSCSVRPIPRQGDQDCRPAVRVVGVSEKKGSFFGNSQDSFAVIPYGAHLKLFGPRQSWP